MRIRNPEPFKTENMNIRHDYIPAGLKALVVLAAMACGTMSARNLESVLAEIERNNVELQAASLDAEAGIAEMEGENMLAGTSVEYSPFFRSGVTGVASSELVVSQEFEFPTRYSSRGKVIRSRREAYDDERRALRNDILLNAKNLYIDIVTLDSRHRILEDRAANASELMRLFRKKYDSGDATGIELNKLELELADIKAALVANETDRANAVLALSVLNGNKPVELDGTEYPLLPSSSELPELSKEYVSSSAAVKAAQAGSAVAGEELKASKGEWLPSLTVGYRRNTETGEASNGFLVGMSFPLYSNGKKVKAARARKAAAELKTDEARAQAESEVAARINELRRVESSLAIYDTALMRQTLDMIRKAVEAGRMSLIEYYTEADAIYFKMDACLSLENRRHRLWAEITRAGL